MNKKSTNKTSGTVIQFPKLKERLIEKGLDAVKGKHFKEAITLLKQAQQMVENHDDLELGILICLFELGELEDAKKQCKKMLQQDIGDYFNVLQIYLTILIQYGQYEEVKATIEAVIEENQVPPHLIENFHSLLELSNKMITTNHPTNSLANEENEKLERLNMKLLEQDDVKEQLMQIQSLKNYNIQQFLPELTAFLGAESKHPMLKSMVLQLLMERGVEDVITIKKFGKTLQVIPAKLANIANHPFTAQVLAQLSDKLSQDNPTLYEVTKELWLRFLFVLFPILPQEEDQMVWAAALHLYGYKLHGFDIDEKVIEGMYDINLFQLHAAIDKIHEIEEISFLQI